MRRLRGLVTILAAAICVAQQAPQDTQGARELFYFGKAPKDELPPIRTPAAPSRGTRGAPANGKNPATPAAAAPAATTAEPAQTSASAAHLGLRYTLLLVNGRGIAQPVDPDRRFRKGECLAMDLESNRSGYLYVLAKQSSGDWIPLFPSPELADQDNRIDPDQAVRAPRGTCFEIEDPPGTENLFVVLSRSSQDINELVRGMRGPGETPGLSNRPAQAASAATIGNAAVEHMSETFGARELVYKQIVNPAAKREAPPKTPSKAPERKEPEHAVYV